MTEGKDEPKSQTEGGRKLWELSSFFLLPSFTLNLTPFPDHNIYTPLVFHFITLRRLSQ